MKTLFSFMASLFFVLLHSLPSSAQVVTSDLQTSEKVGTELEATSEYEDAEDDWVNGIRVIAGLGLNSSLLTSQSSSTTAGIGSNLRSDVGYYFDNGFGVEFSGSVMFNTVRSDLLWSTTLAAGLRFGLPFPFVKSIDNLAPYGRLLVGKATNVAILGGRAPAPYENRPVNRIQGEADMLGAGVGFFQRSSSGRIWYSELTLERHAITKSELVADINGVPTVVGAGPLENKSVLYAICLTFGVMVF